MKSNALLAIFLLIVLVLTVMTYRAQAQRDPFAQPTTHVAHTSQYPLPMQRRLDYAAPFLKSNPHARMLLRGTYRDVTHARQYVRELGIPSRQMSLTVDGSPFELTLLSH